MRYWKILGLAGLIGGVAIGVTVGARRVQRAHREYVDIDITEITARLHARYAECAPVTTDAAAGTDAVRV